MNNTGFYYQRNLNGEIIRDDTPKHGLVEIPRIHATKTVPYVFKGKTYNIKDLKVGTVLTYDCKECGECGECGDFSKKQYAVIETYVKKTKQNSLTTNNAVIAPLIKFDDKTVTYDSNKRNWISLMPKKLSGQQVMQDWSFSPNDAGHFIVDVIMSCQ